MNIIVKLQCGHVRGIESSLMRSELPCRECNDKYYFVAWQVKEVITEQIHVRCKLCTFSRWTGLSSAVGNQVANKHARKHNHHDVDVKLETRPDAVRIKAKLQKRGIIS